MPISISMEITGIEFEQMRDRVNTISQLLDDLSPISRELAECVRDKHLNPLFLSEPSTLTGGPVYGGEYHAPLSPYTLRLHPHRANGQIHIDKGTLFQGAVQEGGSGNRYDVNGSEFTYELTDSRAPDLQDKYKRPILFWHEDLLEEMAKVVLNYQLAVWQGERKL
jgi:hypothetical protein